MTCSPRCGRAGSRLPPASGSRPQTTVADKDASEVSPGTGRSGSIARFDSVGTEVRSPGERSRHWWRGDSGPLSGVRQPLRRGRRRTTRRQTAAGPGRRPDSPRRRLPAAATEEFSFERRYESQREPRGRRPEFRGRPNADESWQLGSAALAERRHDRPASGRGAALCPYPSYAAPRHQAGQFAPGLAGRGLDHRFRAGQGNGAGQRDPNRGHGGHACVTWRRSNSPARPMPAATSIAWA